MENLASQDNNILEINNLNIRIATEKGEHTVVRDISFYVQRGETVGIVGESGSGKSLTALSILGLLPRAARITNGEILFQSQSFGEVNINQLPKAHLRKIRGKEIGMIFQEPMTALNPVFTCGEQIVEMIRLHENLSLKMAKERAIELFEKVKLPNPEQIYKSFPSRLSGGQKQRIMIAMSMACNPNLLIADEPTTALDTSSKTRILDVMQSLRENKNTAMLFISHDLGLIGEVADRVLVMRNGQIVESGTVWDIFSNPKHPYTKGLLACRPRLDIKLKVLPVISDFMNTDESGEVSGFSESKFQSVGQAIMMNYQSQSELKNRYQELVAQKPLLRIENLSVTFPTEKNIFGKTIKTHTAVDNVSFEVFPGETLGLVGESGCGKTTLSRSIIRLVNQVQGKIWFEDEDILEAPDKRLRELRRDIQIIFQDPYSSLNPRIPIGEAIMEPMRIHNILESDKERKERVCELLETVNLSGTHINRYPHEFSGGQRQRICIARTLALQPKFVICDESVSALDVSVQSQVLNLLNRLKERYNLTYIFISHDLAVVKFIADRIMVMNQGKIEEIAFSEDLYKNPQRDYTKQLIRDMPKGNLDDIRKAMLRRKMGQRK